MKNNEILLTYNLQFFADEEGVDSAEPEAANPDSDVEEAGDEPEADDALEDDDEVDEGENEADAADQQSAETNRIYADARRRAEAEAQRKYDLEKARLDKQFADRYAGQVNPETNAPIKSAQDYFDALAAQDRIRANQQLEKAGVDPSFIDRAIANNPLVRQAQQAIEESNRLKAEADVERSLNAILAMDPSISSREDISNLDNWQDVVDYALSHSTPTFNYPLDDAYKIINFDRLRNANVAAAQQQAINQAKSKGHLNTVAGVSNSDTLKDIPAAELSKWKAFFPDKSNKELKALYNKTH